VFGRGIGDRRGIGDDGGGRRGRTGVGDGGNVTTRGQWERFDRVLASGFSDWAGEFGFGIEVRPGERDFGE
jgi:hypothetical protein